jgi:sugar phosphate isomerase/epimerase
MQIAMSEVTTFRWSFEEDVRRYSELGYQGIGVWRQKLSDFGEDRGIDLLNESGLSVSSLTWTGGFTGGDFRTHREAIDEGIDALRLAAAMGAECLVVYTGARGGHTKNHARRLALTAISELADLAEDLDVVMAIEPMHPGCASDWTFLTQLDETLEFLDQVQSPAVKLVFDTYHLGHSPIADDLFAALVPRIGLVQLGDARKPPLIEQDRCALGEGVLPLRKLLAQLIDLGYDGFFEIELLGEEIELCDYGRLLESSQQSVAQFAVI